LFVDEIAAEGGCGIFILMRGVIGEKVREKFIEFDRGT